MLVVIVSQTLCSEKKNDESVLVRLISHFTRLISSEKVVNFQLLAGFTIQCPVFQFNAGFTSLRQF